MSSSASQPSSRHKPARKAGPSLAKQAVKLKFKARLSYDPGKGRISYDPSRGVPWFTKQLREATPPQKMEVERHGVKGLLIKDLAKKMDVPYAAFYEMLDVPKATVEKKASSGQVIVGAAGLAILGIVKLLGIAQGIVDKSTASDAEGFDTERWFGQWIGRPQPSLGGKKPSEFLDTPTGIEIVARLLGAMESGAYL